MRKIFFALVLLILCTCAEAAFVPEVPVMTVGELKPGMKGYALTVMKGLEPVRIPVQVVSIIPQNPGKSIKNEILIKFTDNTRLAQGMSGSPVYVNGRLIGAIRSGWDFSDHTMALLAPIEDMCRVFDYPDAENKTLKDMFELSAVSFSGIDINTPSMKRLAETLGVSFTQGISSGGSYAVGTGLKPGDSVTALLVWGDVEMGVVGTVTAKSRQGRILAFGHKFMKRGTASYPAARTYIHGLVNNATFPFKLATAQTLEGTFTQDREAGLGGRLGYFLPSISAELVFRNLDTNITNRYKFRVAADEFMAAELITSMYSGLCEEAWGRKGQGTMSVNLRIDGRNVPDGWARRDIFFSEEDVTASALEQARAIIGSYLTQPFSEIMPVGFMLDVSASQRPKMLIIEEIDAPESAKPGQEIEVTVRLRGWRAERTERKFTMRIPEDAEEGVCELIVRGGGEDSMRQVSVEEGWKSIASLERMLTEFKARDANNELVLELNIDRSAETLKKILEGKKDKNTKAVKEPDLLPEEEEYLSETKARRIKEGSLRVYSSDYFVDGMMKKIIHVEN